MRDLTADEDTVMRRALIASTQPVLPWLPIETAPKDEEETCILICNCRCAQYRVAYYEHDVDPTYPWHVEDAANGFNHHKDWPTHWMPLPARPRVEPVNPHTE